MEFEEANIPVPILLNCWKHHKNFIRKKISEIFNSGEEGINILKFSLQQIGNSQLDLYLGNITPMEISLQIKNNLKNKNLLEKEPYEKWISESQKFYRMITLSDNSKWTLRLGNDKTRYVHIHPGRYAANTIRIRALTLKTAIIYLYNQQMSHDKIDDLTTINDLRKEFLNVPPLKSLSKSKGLAKIIELLKI